LHFNQRGLIVKFITKAVVSILMTLFLVGCFGNDKPSDADIKNVIFQGNEYFVVKDFQKLNGVALDNKRYKVMYKYKIVFNKDPRDIPDYILKKVAAYKVAQEAGGEDLGFLGIIAVMGTVNKLKKYTKGDVLLDEEGETVFIKSEKGWIEED